MKGVLPGDRFKFQQPHNFMALLLVADVKGDVVTLRNATGNPMIVCPLASLPKLMRFGLEFA